MNFSFQFNITDKKTQSEVNLPAVETAKTNTSINTDKATEILSNTPESASDKKRFISAKEITDLVAEHNKRASEKHKHQMIGVFGCLASIILLAATIAATIAIYVIFVVPTTRRLGSDIYLNFHTDKSFAPLMTTLGVLGTGFVTSVSGLVASSFWMHREFSNGQNQPQTLVIKA
jgi:hypothetical protein